MITLNKSMSSALYVKESEEAKAVEEFSDNLINWNYPANESIIYYCEWDIFNVGGEDFFNVIQNLMNHFKDDYFYFIDLMILKSSDHINIYKKKFKQFPIVKVGREVVYNEFIGKLQDSYKYKKVYYEVFNTNTYSIIPSSGKWFFYGDYDIQIGKLVLSENFVIKDLFPRNWNNSDPALYEKKDMKENLNKFFNFYINKLEEFNKK